MSKRQWQQKETSSFDYKLMFCFSIISFIFLPISILLSLKGVTTATIILVIAGIFINLGIKHRIKHQWRWQGVKGTALYKAIGFTAIYIFMLPNLLVNLFYGTNRDSGRIEFNWQPDNPFKTLSETIKIFSRFINSPEYSIHFGFFCLMVIGIIFNILFGWRVIYLSEKDFLKDCINPNSITNKPKLNQTNSQSLNSWLAKFTAFFSSRPFIVSKQQDTVKITFNKVTTYDLKANLGLLLFLSLFFIAAIYGLITMVIYALPEYLSNVENSQQQIAILFAWFFQVLAFAVVAFFIWNPWLKAIFVRTIIEFNPDEIIVWEQAFGSQRKILSISQSDLLPLQEKQVNTQVPQVRNTSLRIRYRRRNIELAGHLLPKAMDTVRNTYDCYRNNSFSYFYDRVENIYLE